LPRPRFCFTSTQPSALAAGALAAGDKVARRPLLMEIWRLANLAHLLAYASGVGPTRTARVCQYSVRLFVIPVAVAFGEHDGGQKLGMLSPAEVSELEELAENPDLASLLLYARLYDVVQQATHAKLSSVAWPVWGAALRDLRTSLEAIAHLHADRLPHIYVLVVRLVCVVTLSVNFFYIGAWAGYEYMHYDRLAETIVADTNGYKSAWNVGSMQVIVLWFSATLVCLVIAMLQLLQHVADAMQDPLGHDTRDIPVLSIVSNTARETLELVVKQGASAFADHGERVGALVRTAALTPHRAHVDP